MLERGLAHSVLLELMLMIESEDQEMFEQWSENSSQFGWDQANDPTLENLKRAIVEVNMVPVEGRTKNPLEHYIMKK